MLTEYAGPRQAAPAVRPLHVTRTAVARIRKRMSFAASAVVETCRGIRRRQETAPCLNPNSKVRSAAQQRIQSVDFNLHTAGAVQQADIQKSEQHGHTAHRTGVGRGLWQRASADPHTDTFERSLHL